MTQKKTVQKRLAGLSPSRKVGIGLLYLVAFITIFALVGLDLPVARAAETVGSGTPESCTQAAFEDALRDGGNIEFNCGPGNVSIPITGQKIISSPTPTTIDGGSKITLQGNGSVRIFAVDRGRVLELRNLIIRDGWSDGFLGWDPDGGTIRNNGGTVSISGCLIVSSEATGHGGAIFNDENSVLTINNSSFQQNLAKQGRLREGGAIYNQRNATANINNSQFIGNQAFVKGGAISNYGVLTVANTSFSGNGVANTLPADDWQRYTAGGAIYSTGPGPLAISNSRFENNTAFAGSGGAVFTNIQQTLDAPPSLPPTITDSYFSNNVADLYGGAIFTTQSDINTSNNIFVQNRSQKGGAIYHVNGTLTVNSSLFDRNQATGYGGAISQGEETSAVDSGLEIANSTFSTNSAGQDGGAIYNSVAGSNFQNRVALYHTTFSGNQAAGSGGAIFNGPGQPAQAVNTIIANSVLGGNCAGSITAGGPNLQWPGTECGPGFTQSDPLLKPLAENGSPRATFGLNDGSPALDAADQTACAAPPVNNRDQRGRARPFGLGCDIGAYEQDAIPPVLSKAFEPATIAPGGVTQLVFRVRNPLPGRTLENIQFNDELPAQIKVASPADVSASPGCTGSTIGAVPGSNLVSVTIAKIEPRANCEIRVKVTSVVLGVWQNVISTITTSEGVFNKLNNPVRARLTVSNDPGLGKSFNPPAIGVGGSSRLSLTLFNPPGSTRTFTNIAFDDTLPAGLIIASPPDLVLAGCNPGLSVTAVAGTNIIQVRGGSLSAPNETCTITVSVTPTGQNPASYLNQITSLSYQGPSGTITVPVQTEATLQVLRAPTFELSFVPPTIAPTGQTSLRLRIFNLNTGGGQEFTGLGAHISLPPQITVVESHEVNSTCNADAAFDFSSPADIQVENVSLAPNRNCQIEISVTSPTNGNWEIELNSYITDQLGPAANSLRANLNVSGAAVFPTVAKSFTPANVGRGQSVHLTFTLSNPRATPLTNLNFTDRMPAGLLIAPGGVILNDCGGTVEATPGTGLIRISGVNLDGGSSCTIRVRVRASATGRLVNQTGLIGSNETGRRLISNAASLNVDTDLSFPAVTKSFSPTTIERYAVARLTFTVHNHTFDTIMDNIRFTDLMPPALQVAPNPAVTSDCGSAAVIDAATGSNIIGVSGISMLPGGLCNIGVDVVANRPGIWSNTTSQIGSNQTGFGPPSNTASLTVNCDPLFVTSVSNSTADCGTLRHALEHAGTTGYGNIITVDPLLVSPVMIRVEPGVSLPPFHRGVFLIGRCESGPAVTIDGTGATGPGLVLGGDNRLFGLTISGFSGPQLRIPAGAGNNRLECVRTSARTG